jgi:hypothetical protein
MTTRHLVLITLAAALMAGCSTTRQDRSAQAADSMAALNKLLDKGADRAVRLADATDKVSAVNPADLRKAYDQFARETAAIRSIAEDVRSRASAMKKRSRKYLAQWEKEISGINSIELKKMSRERLALMEQDFRKITADMATLGQAYEFCEANISDIERFLGNDLTATGRELAKPALEHLAAQVLKVKSVTRSTQDTVAHLETMLKPR